MISLQFYVEYLAFLLQVFLYKKLGSCEVNLEQK